MKQPLRQLDLSSFPEITHIDPFSRLDLDIEETFTNSLFAETYERAQSAVMFFCSLKKREKTWKNSAFLRAGLNEFYSMSDAAKRDHKNKKLNGEPASIENSKNPLVQIMYLLRHSNVHACIANTRASLPTTLISTVGNESHEIDWSSIILDTPTIELLMRCKEAKKHYNQEQLEQSAKWLDKTQTVFGIGHVLRKGVSTYCRELLAHQPG